MSKQLAEELDTEELEDGEPETNDYEPIVPTSPGSNIFSVVAEIAFAALVLFNLFPNQPLLRSCAEKIGLVSPATQTERAKKPYIGLGYDSTDTEHGVWVKSVIKNSPADKAGIQANDVILFIGEDYITSDNPLDKLLQKYRVGDTVTLDVVRLGVNGLTTFHVKLEERP